MDALRASLADRYRIERALGQGGMATCTARVTSGTIAMSPSRS